MDKESIISSLKKACQMYSLSEEDIAEFLHVSVSSIQKKRTGKRNISLDEIEKLSKNQPWKIDDFLKGDLPDIELKKMSASILNKIYLYRYPILCPPDKYPDSDLQSVCDLHIHLRTLCPAADDIFFDRMNFPEYINHLRECKKSYAEYFKTSWKFLAIANMISLTLLYATIINAFIHPEEGEGLLQFTLNKQFNINKSTETDEILGGFDFQKAYMELHSENVSSHLHKYIDYLSSCKGYSDLTQYFSALIYAVDLYDPKIGRKKSLQIFQQKQDELYKSNNFYMVNMINMLCDLYHI